MDFTFLVVLHDLRLQQSFVDILEKVLFWGEMYICDLGEVKGQQAYSRSCIPLTEAEGLLKTLLCFRGFLTAMIQSCKPCQKVDIPIQQYFPASTAAPVRDTSQDMMYPTSPTSQCFQLQTLSCVYSLYHG